MFSMVLMFFTTMVASVAATIAVQEYCRHRKACREYRRYVVKHVQPAQQPDLRRTWTSFSDNLGALMKTALTVAGAMIACALLAGCAGTHAPARNQVVPRSGGVYVCHLYQAGVVYTFDDSPSGCRADARAFGGTIATPAQVRQQDSQSQAW